MTVLSPGVDLQNNSLAGNIPVRKSPLSIFWVWEGGGRREEEGRGEVGTFRAIRWQLL